MIDPAVLRTLTNRRCLHGFFRSGEDTDPTALP